jgi:hypothetical protein
MVLLGHRITLCQPAMGPKAMMPMGIIYLRVMRSSLLSSLLEQWVGWLVTTEGWLTLTLYNSVERWELLQSVLLNRLQPKLVPEPAVPHCASKDTHTVTLLGMNTNDGLVPIRTRQRWLTDPESKLSRRVTDTKSRSSQVSREQQAMTLNEACRELKRLILGQEDKMERRLFEVSGHKNPQIYQTTWMIQFIGYPAAGQHPQPDSDDIHHQDGGSRLDVSITCPVPKTTGQDHPVYKEPASAKESQWKCPRGMNVKGHLYVGISMGKWPTGLMGMGMVAEMPDLWHTIPILAVSWLLTGIWVTGWARCWTLINNRDLWEMMTKSSFGPRWVLLLIFFIIFLQLTCFFGFMYVLTMLLPQYHNTDWHSHQHPDHCHKQLLAGWEQVQFKPQDGMNEQQGQQGPGTEQQWNKTMGYEEANW